MILLAFTAWAGLVLPAKTDMKTWMILLLPLLVTGCAMKLDGQADAVVVNPHYAKADTLQRLMQRYVDLGVPGIVLSIYSPTTGWWGTAAGYARTEDKTPMTLDHLHYLQSVAKTFMAVEILRLYEQGRIGLDRPITDYLPERYARYLPSPKRITVRMLLQHRSGLPDYSYQPEYVDSLLAHPEQSFTSEDYVRFVQGKPMEFEPGTAYKYLNLNYLLLALIADELTGDHARAVRQNILQPLDMQHTLYRDTPDYLDHPMLVDSYGDLAQTGEVLNLTQMQRVNVASLIGDDGIVATPFDAVRFLRGLVEGHLLADTTHALMTDWTLNTSGKPAYGMGLIPYDLGGIPAYGHGGGGIGAGCGLFYFPEQELYVFMAVNYGMVLDSPLGEKVLQMQLELLSVLLG